MSLLRAVSLSDGVKDVKAVFENYIGNEVENQSKICEIEESLLFLGAVSTVPETPDTH